MEQWGCAVWWTVQDEVLPKSVHSWLDAEGRGCACQLTEALQVATSAHCADQLVDSETKKGWSSQAAHRQRALGYDHPATPASERPLARKALCLRLL
jgi:hypothetical protein